MSGIGAVLARPDGQRTRWLLALHRGGIGSRQVVRFLNHLKHHRRPPVILRWNGLTAHRSRLTRQALLNHADWLRLETLPAYAPELNPVEQLWAYLDATSLANTPWTIWSACPAGCEAVWVASVGTHTWVEPSSAIQVFFGLKCCSILKTSIELTCRRGARKASPSR